MQETRVWYLGQEDSLEEEMATHSSILAWKIPWIEEPDGLYWGLKESDTTEWLTSCTHTGKGMHRDSASSTSAKGHARVFRACRWQNWIPMSQVEVSKSTHWSRVWSSRCLLGIKLVKGGGKQDWTERIVSFNAAWTKPQPAPWGVLG